jgi:hypothetical protein
VRFRHHAHAANAVCVQLIQQEEVIAELYEGGCCSPRPDRTEYCERAKARYGDYLALVAIAVDESASPPADVDLIWHTHQLHPDQYR